MGAPGIYVAWREGKTTASHWTPLKVPDNSDYSIFSLSERQEKEDAIAKIFLSRTRVVKTIESTVEGEPDIVETTDDVAAWEHCKDRSEKYTLLTEAGHGKEHYTGFKKGSYTFGATGQYIPAPGRRLITLEKRIQEMTNSSEL